MLVLAGCNVLTSTGTHIPEMPTNIPLQQATTVAPPYIHYKPSQESSVHLEFDYPGSWTFSEDMQYANLVMIIALGDPRFRTLPTFPDSYSPSDFGSVIIWISPAKPNQTSFTELDVVRQGYLREPRYYVISDYIVTIDGYDAGVLEYTIEPTAEDYPSVMFNKRILVVVNDQLYVILFTVAEKERGGEFEKGFEYFLNSLKIVP